MTTYEHTVKIRLKEDKKGMKKSISMSKMTDKTAKELHQHHQLPSISSTLALPPIKSHYNEENENEDKDAYSRNNKQTILKKNQNSNLKSKERRNQLDTNERALNMKHKEMTQEVQSQAGKKLTQLKDMQTKQAKAVQEAESNRYTTSFVGRKLPKE